MNDMERYEDLNKKLDAYHRLHNTLIDYMEDYASPSLVLAPMREEVEAEYRVLWEEKNELQKSMREAGEFESHTPEDFLRDEIVEQEEKIADLENLKVSVLHKICECGSTNLQNKIYEQITLELQAAVRKLAIMKCQICGANCQDAKYPTEN